MVEPKRQLGQNFLHDEQAAERFAAALHKCKSCLEIGPGLGIITKPLAKRCLKLTAIEIDPWLEGQLKKKLANYKLKNVELKIGDALLEDFSPYGAIVGALPYHLASQIIEKFMRSKCKQAVFIVQKEVAGRLMAKPSSGDYSRLSILVQNGAQAEILEILPPELFWPQPQVHSALVKIRKTGKKVKINDDLVRALFQHKNQNIRKALRHSGEKWAKIAEKIPQELAAKRARELTLQELQIISKLL